MIRNRILRTVFVAVTAAACLAPIGCGGGGSSGTTADKDLYLVRFLLVDDAGRNLGASGTTNAFRDTRIKLEFNVPVDPDSVSSRTIIIGIPTGQDLFLEAVGRFEIAPGQPNVVLFNPTFTKNNEGSVPDNPLGLDANAFYEIRIPSVLEAEKVVTNLSGGGVVRSYNAAFATSDEYIQNYVQPENVWTNPEAGQTGVHANADIIFKFTVPMKPDSFRIGDTVVVKDKATGRDVLGQLRFSADATEVTFRPVFGYGKGPSNIFVLVTTGVTNLPGNPIPKEIRFEFWSAFDNTQPDFADIPENFSNKNFQDTSFTNVFPLAGWDEGVTAGFLAGISTSGKVELSKGTNSYNYEPWGIPNFNMLWQGLYLSAEMGTARTITGFEYYKWSYSNFSCNNVVMQMGHNTSGSLTTNFNGNYSDTPQNVVASTTYNITNSPSFAWTAGPQFTSQYKYNGTDNLIVEIAHTGASLTALTYGAGLWRVATGQSVQKTAYTTNRGTSPVTYNYHYDIRFSFFIDESEALSLFYDSYDSIGVIAGTTPVPQYLSAVFTPALADQPAGTTSLVEFQGAHGETNDPDIIDLNSTSNWTHELPKVSGYRYVRFRATFKGNPQTKQQPQIDRLVMPFIYF